MTAGRQPMETNSAAEMGARPYSDDWDGPIFVLTHRPEDATPAEGVTFLNCDPAEAVRIGLEAAGGKNLEVMSPPSAGSSSHWD